MDFQNLQKDFRTFPKTFTALWNEYRTSGRVNRSQVLTGKHSEKEIPNEQLHKNDGRRGVDSHASFDSHAGFCTRPGHRNRTKHRGLLDQPNNAKRLSERCTVTAISNSWFLNLPQRRHDF